MKVAYLITAHAFPKHFIKMVKSLDSAESLFFIHIDKKSDIRPFKEVEKEVDTSKIKWLKRRSQVWSGFNAVKVTIEGLRQIAEYKDAIDYVCHISGQHYPIRHIKQFHEYLNRHNGKSFLEYSAMPRPNWANGGLDRIHYYHFIFRHFRIALPLISYLKVKLPFVAEERFPITRKVVKMLPAAKKFPRKFLKGCRPFEGSNWFTFHISLVQDILKSISDDPSVYNFFRHTHCSDEMFFQTLVINKLPHQVANVVNNNLLYIKWDQTTGRPYTLNEHYLSEIQQSKAFLARKFEPDASAVLLEKLDRIIAENEKKHNV